MSFRKDDSLGPGDAAEINQNISFESIHQQDDINPQQQNPSENFFKIKLIHESLNDNLNNIFRIFKNRALFTKQKLFLELMHINDTKKINQYKAEIIFSQIAKSARCIIRIYKKRERFALFKTFLKWHSIVRIKGHIALVKSQIEMEYENLIVNGLNELEEKIKSKEREISGLKKTLNNLIVLENDLSKKIKLSEENKKSFQKLITKREEEKRIIEEDLKAQVCCTGDDTERYKLMEEKIKEYESQIFNLQEESKEKDYNINLFLREMGEMLQAHEKNFDLLNSKIDVEEYKTPMTNIKQNPKNLNMNNVNCVASLNSSGENRPSSNYSSNPIQSNQSFRNTTGINKKFSIGLTKKKNYWSNGGKKK